MAVVLSNNVGFHFNGYDPGTATTRIAVIMAADPLDVTVFQQAAERMTGGIRHDALEWAGLVDDATGSAGTALAQASTLLGTGSWYLTVYIGTNRGSNGFAATAAYLAEKASGEVLGLIRQEARWELDGTWAHGKTLEYKLAYTGLGSSGGSVDNGAATTAGGYWFIQQHSGTGTHAFDDSADGTTFAQFTSIAGVVGPTGTFISLGTGTIRRYVQIRRGGLAQTGTFSSMFVRL